MTAKTGAPTDFDGILQRTVGGFGPYQQFLVVLLCIPACFMSSFGTFDVIFSAYTPKFTCQLPMHNDSTNGTQKNGILGFKENFTAASDQCSYTYDVINGTVLTRAKADCANWNYSKEYLGETIITKWNLVCDKAFLARSMLSILNLSTLVAIVYAYIQDKYGRKKAFLVNLVIYTVGNVAVGIFPKNVIEFGIFKFIAGITCIWEICFCWALEFVGEPSKRTVVSTMMSVTFGVANLVLPLVAWLCQDWNSFMLSISAPFVLLFLFIWLVPESPRWLLACNRIDDAAVVIQRLGTWQKKQVDFEKTKKMLMQLKPCSTENNAPTENMSIMNFLLSRNLLAKNLVMTVAIVVANQLYSTIPYDSENLFPNFYVAYLLPTLVEVPATLINLFLVNKLGRVMPLSGLMCLSALCCLLTWPFDKYGAWVTLVLASISRFFICAALGVQEQMAEELYPTIGRGIGTGISYIASALFGVAMQYLVYLSVVWKILPLLIMGILTLSSSILCLFLPDTHRKPLPDSVAKAEAQGSVGFKAFKENICFESYRKHRKDNDRS